MTWKEDRKLVFEKLDCLDSKVGEIRSEQKSMREMFNNFCIKTASQVSALKVKSGIWGVLGGISAVGGMAVVALLKGCS